MTKALGGTRFDELHTKLTVLKIPGAYGRVLKLLRYLRAVYMCEVFMTAHYKFVKS